MNAKLVSFGAVEIDGKHFNHDVVIENGTVRERLKKPSKSVGSGRHRRSRKVRIAPAIGPHARA